MTRSWVISLVLFMTAGCATHTPPAEQLSVRQDIENGTVYAGQAESEFLERCRPDETSQVGGLRLYQFVVVRGYEGLLVIARDGHLVSAFYWTDYGYRHVYFDTMTDADRSLLKDQTHLG